MARSRSEWIVVIPAVLWSLSLVSCDVAKGDVSIPTGYPISEIERVERVDEPTTQIQTPAESWVVDAKDPGPNLPSVGRSLFDYVTARSDGHAHSHDVPFPFSSLVQLIADRIGLEKGVSHAKRVLMPLNRSLQRHAPRGALPGAREVVEKTGLS